MRRYECSAPVRFGLLALGLLLMASSAQAHVLLLEPNGGEQLEVGSVFTITWRIQIAHSLQNWDLWYSTTGSAGPWITIASNLAPGSPAANSVHTYDWTVPDVVDDSLWVRVRMDNSGTDYYDVSNSSFSVIPAAATGDVGDQLRVVKLETDIVLLWGASCAEADTDFSVYEGRLGAFTSHAPVFCSTAGSMESDPFSPGSGDRYFLVVPRQTAKEGSYGADSEGSPRPPSVFRCLPPAPVSCS